MGIWSVAAKPSWANLSPLETEIVGFIQATIKLHYYISGAPVIYGYCDHKPFIQMYEDKDLQDLTPRALKLMQDLLELPFSMRYCPAKSEFIKAVDACSRAPVEPHTNMFHDPMDRPYHPKPVSYTHLTLPTTPYV